MVPNDALLHEAELLVQLPASDVVGSDSTLDLVEVEPKERLFEQPLERLLAVPLARVVRGEGNSEPCTTVLLLRLRHATEAHVAR